MFRYAAALWPGLIVTTALSPQALHAQTSNEMSTSDIQRAAYNSREVSLTTRLSKLTEESVLLKTRDGELQVRTAIDTGRFVDMPATVKVQDVGDLGLQVTEITAHPSPAWEKMTSSQRQRFPDLDRAQFQLKSAINRALGSGGDDAEWASARVAASNVEDKLVDAYASIPAPLRRAQGRPLVDQHVELKALQRNTFREDYNERYPPETYQRIYASTRGAPALRVKGQELPQCTGVLVAKNLVLTNRHCVSYEEANQFEVVFDYEEDLSGDRMTPRAFPVSEIKFRGGEPYLDFSVLEVAPDPSGNLPGNIYPPQCIATSTPKRHDAIYVVGFPLGQPRVVHDNTHVYFPFRASAEEFSLIEIDVRGEFAPGPEEDRAYIDGKLKELKDSYVERMDMGQKVYEYYSKRFGDQPTIGVDSDTYPGNSGSPAFSRRTHALVGLLFDGHRTDDEPWSPGWRKHEAILPISKIVESINQQEPDWFALNGICMR